jgi:hypothetical protein
MDYLDLMKKENGEVKNSSNGSAMEESTAIQDQPTVEPVESVEEELLDEEEGEMETEAPAS